MSRWWGSAELLLSQPVGNVDSDFVFNLANYSARKLKFDNDQNLGV